jgi:hypothetical protein
MLEKIIVAVIRALRRKSWLVGNPEIIQETGFWRLFRDGERCAMSAVTNL